MHLPGIYVKRIFQGTNYQKRIEKRTLAAPKPVGDPRVSISFKK